MDKLDRESVGYFDGRCCTIATSDLYLPCFTLTGRNQIRKRETTTTKIYNNETRKDVKRERER